MKCALFVRVVARIARGVTECVHYIAFWAYFGLTLPTFLPLWAKLFDSVPGNFQWMSWQSLSLLERGPQLL
jgi:hypothetical protein